MSQLPIDIDAEAIFFDGHWYTRDDMARRIKAMLDQGDFAVARPSAALEELTAVIASVRTVAFRATPDMIESINAGAARAGKSVGAFIRDTLSQQLGLPGSDFGPARVGDATEVIRGTPPAVAQPAAAQQAPIAGPGALRNAGVQALPSVVVDVGLASEPVELTNKKTKEDESTERRWFNT